MSTFFTKMASTKREWFLKESSIILLAGLSLFLLFSFTSYSPTDSSWFYQSITPHPVANRCGSWGAQIAALGFYLAGSACFLLVCLLWFFVYMLVFQRTWRQEWDRVTALLLLLFVIPSLLTLYSVDFWGSPYPGGFIGYQLTTRLTAAADAVGAALFLHCLLLVSAILLLRFSFIGCINRVLKKLSEYMQRRKGATGISAHIARYCQIVAHAVQLTVATVKHYAVVWLLPKGDAPIEFEGGIIDTSLLQQLDAELNNRAHVKSAPSPAAPAPVPVPVAPVPEAQESPLSQEVAAASLPQAPEAPAYVHPNLDIFIAGNEDQHDASLMQELEKRAALLQEKLERFGVFGKVVAIKRGPVVTLFEYQPQMDTKISKITALEDDLAMVLQALSIRIIAPIPGKSVVGFEIANRQRKGVLLSSLVKSEQYTHSSAALPMVLGVDTIGNPVVIDLAKMPHLLIAGSTGSGKSVALNAMLVSMLCKCSPDDLRLILIDPKRLEFAPYADIGHLVFPIVTDTKQAPFVLRWVVEQMEERYERMAVAGARNIHDYRAQAVQSGEEPMPYIVVIIDELSDLMMTAGKEVEDLIIRITQMARAAGIHLIAATQRPSVDVITGLIKVNFPSRISFKVSSRVDSRTILDCAGADKLLGKGDMLFLDATDGALKRLHGAYVLDKEITQIVQHIRSQRPPSYLDIQQVCRDHSLSDDIEDDMYGQVCEFLKEIDEVSISLLQRRFRIGYNRSARLIDKLAAQGLISPAYSGKTRKVIR